MAEVFPSEGLDHILAIFPKNGTNTASLYVGLFYAANGTTVPASGAALTTVNEMSSGAGNGYSRKLITGSVGWGAAANTPNLDGRRVSATSGVQWTASSNLPAQAAGFFLATSAVISAGTAIYYANFDDASTVTLNTNDTLTVTPWLGFTP